MLRNKMDALKHVHTFQPNMLQFYTTLQLYDTPKTQSPSASLNAFKSRCRKPRKSSLIHPLKKLAFSQSVCSKESRYIRSKSI